MTSTVFTSGTVIESPWLNDVNTKTYADTSNTVAYTPAGTGAVATTVQAKLRESVNVKDFGAVGDGTTDDTAAIQAALSTGKYVVFTDGIYSVTSALTYTGDGLYMQAGSSLQPQGTGYTVLTIERKARSGPYRIYINGSGQTLNGVYINQAAQSYFEYICVNSLNGFGVKFNEIYDSVVNDIFTESCGNSSEYAFSVVKNTDTSNTSTFNRLQVETSNEKAIYIDSTTLACTFQTIHTERTTATSVRDAWVLGGDRCTYNTVRCTASGTVTNARVLLKGSATVYNAFSSQGLIPVRFEGVTGTSLTLVEPNIAGVLSEESGQIGRLMILAGNVGSAVPSNTRYFGTKIAGSYSGVLTNDGNITLGTPTSYARNTSLGDGSGAYAGRDDSTSKYIYKLIGDAGTLHGAIGLSSSIGGAFQVGSETAIPTRIMYNAAGVLEITSNIGTINGIFRPSTDNTRTLGEAGSRWSVVYAGTGAINTSDSREKEQIQSINDKEKAVAVKIKSLLKAFKFKNAVIKKDLAARIHFGVMAQDVKTAFESEGLIAEDYALFCYDEWEQETDENGNVTKESGNRYGIRYDELLCFIVAAI